MKRFEKFSSQSSNSNQTMSSTSTTSLHHLDLDSYLFKENGRKLFQKFLKEKSTDNLLTVYLIMSCFENKDYIEKDPERIKQILERVYSACFVKNQITHLSFDLKAKFADRLQKKIYDEPIFNSVKKELKNQLEYEFPMFLQSKMYRDSKKLSANKNADTISLNEEYATINDLYTNDTHEYCVVKDQSYPTQMDDDKRLIHNSKPSKIPSMFAMPNVPALKSKPTSNRMLKQSKSSSSSTSSVASTTSKRPTSASRTNEPINSGVKHSHSKLSLTNDSTMCSTKSKNYPPNPYHVVTKAIPVSAQDSELQSTYSADYPDEYALRCSRNLNEMSSLSGSKASLNHSRLPRLHKDVKASLIANQNCEINMPEFQPEQSAQQMKKSDQDCKQKPISESDPNQFFELLASKLNNLVLNNEPADYEAHDFNLRDNFEKLSIPIESDFDNHIDEHINRVYSNDTNSKSQLYNSVLNNSTFHDAQNLTSTNAKMFKVSSLHKQMDMNGTLPESFYANQASNQTKPKLNTSLSASLSHRQRGKSKDTDDNHHHFYKLTSTSKEVDIDHHTHHLEDSKVKKTKNDANKTTIAQSKSKSNKANATMDMNYDSGVSIRSAASIERVNDWLTNSGYQPNRVENEPVKSNNHKKVETKKMAKEIPSDFKTTVAYYLPGEDVAYISTFNGKHLTLSQFKQFITKKGQFRYFFKTKSDLLDDEECVVFQEATDENALVPMFNSKVIAKIEKINEN